MSRISCQKNFNITVTLPSSKRGIYFVAPDANPATKKVIWQCDIAGGSPTILPAFTSTYYNLRALDVSSDNGFVYLSCGGTLATPVEPGIVASQCNGFFDYSAAYNVGFAINADAIAVDDVDEMLYWIFAGQIKRGTITGLNAVNYWSAGPFAATDLALDTTNKKVYWVCQDGIRRSSMSPGTTELLRTPQAGYWVDRSLCIDVPNNYLFWFETNIAQNLVFRASLDGSNVVQIYNISATQSPAYQGVMRQYNSKLYICFPSSPLPSPLCTMFVNPWLVRMNEDGTGYTNILLAPAGFDPCSFPITHMAII